MSLISQKHPKDLFSNVKMYPKYTFPYSEQVVGLQSKNTFINTLEILHIFLCMHIDRMLRKVPIKS